VPRRCAPPIHASSIATSMPVITGTAPAAAPSRPTRRCSRRRARRPARRWRFPSACRPAARGARARPRAARSWAAVRCGTSARC
jgi:hypothetical protein